MNKRQQELLAALDARSQQLAGEQGGGGLDWVLLDDAAREIRLLEGGSALDRLLLNGSTDIIDEASSQIEKLKADQAKLLDRLLFVMTTIEHSADVSPQWIHTEINDILSGHEA